MFLRSRVKRNQIREKMRYDKTGGKVGERQYISCGEYVLADSKFSFCEKSDSVG